jgi:hypothetical protein
MHMYLIVLKKQIQNLKAICDGQRKMISLLEETCQLQEQLIKEALVISVSIIAIHNLTGPCTLENPCSYCSHNIVTPDSNNRPTVY